MVICFQSKELYYYYGSASNKFFQFFLFNWESLYIIFIFEKVLLDLSLMVNRFLFEYFEYISPLLLASIVSDKSQFQIL